MKREFEHENFEEFIKRNADNLRMKAPERVWENLSGQLNKGRKKVGFGLSAFFFVTAVFSYLTITNTTRLVRVTEEPMASEQQSSAEATAKIINMADVPRRTKQAPVLKPTELLQQTEAVDKIEETTLENSINDTEKLFAANEGEAATEGDFVPTIVDSYPNREVAKEVSAEETKPSAPQLQAINNLPWSIESAVNAYRSDRKRLAKNRFQTQFHFAPTISYRKLTENKSYLRNSSQGPSSGNYAALYSSVDNMVTHKPDMGFELGITEKYAVSQKVLVRAGLQFNVNRYDIKAFHAPFALAAIALNNRRTASVDSLWTISNYSNVAASNNNQGSWLQNFSFQASAPVGAELVLKGTEKMQFGIAGTVQPTYILGDRSYMITNDYKSYTQVPWLLRRWNVNTALETFVTYQSGKTRWQVGPQIRYQLLSSFISNYPVKENLFDFGLKVGLSVIK